MNKLLPCPFCGGEARLLDYKKFGGDVGCPKCRIIFQERSKKLALKAWNTRAVKRLSNGKQLVNECGKCHYRWLDVYTVCPKCNPEQANKELIEALQDKESQ